MMKTKDIKKGISLIVLIITIIVVIILAAVVILTLSKNNPIESAKEARFKEDVRTFQDELALTVSKQYTTAGGHRDTKITTSDFNEIQGYIPSFSEKYKDKFAIQDDELVYTKQLDDIEKEYAQSLNVKEKQKLLPDEYQQVEYIESTGTQWIDTKWFLQETEDDFEMNVEFETYTTQNVNWATICGVDYGSFGEKQYYVLQFNNTINQYIVVHNTDLNQSVQLRNITDKKHKINVKYLNNITNIIIDDENQQTLEGTIKLRGKNTCYLFARNHSNKPVSHIKIKLNSWYIIVNSKFVRNFIPCYSKTVVIDVNGKECPIGTIGLYDTVEGKFYTNQGTGEFIAGPEVNE